MNRQKLILLILFILLVIMLIVAYFRTPRQKTVEKLTYQQGATAQLSSNVTSKAPPVIAGNLLRLDLLDIEPPPFKGARRNLFNKNNFINPGAKSAQKIASPPPPPPPPPPPTPLEIMRRSLASYTFIGLITINGEKTCFFRKGVDLVSVRVGGRLAGKYEAVAITDQFLTIKTPDTAEQLMLPLLEKEIPTIIQRGRGQSRNQGI